MSQTLTHCPVCDKKFENDDEIVETNASRALVIVHSDCLDSWLDRWVSRSYFSSYADFLKYMGLD